MKGICNPALIAAGITGAQNNLGGFATALISYLSLQLPLNHIIEIL
jgi:hypothetical protein